MITLIVTVVVAPVPIVAAMFSADIMAVNPMVPKAGHVAGYPDHFVFTTPIARAMIIKWAVANFDLDAIGSNSCRDQNARRQNGQEQKFVFRHAVTDHARVPAANTVLVVRHAFPL